MVTIEWMRYSTLVLPDDYLISTSLHFETTMVLKMILDVRVGQAILCPDIKRLLLGEDVQIPLQSRKHWGDNAGLLRRV